jgi:arsenite/tail-anchored protein-transporting ATPase
MTALAAALGDAPFTFVVGKGGTGKTTTAGALALELADGGIRTHLISTDPAHSLADLFRHEIGTRVVTSQCNPLLTLEEFDAGAYTDRWVAHALEAVAGIVEAGTYLDGEDVAAFSRLALPGVDELMGVLRLADLATAPDRAERIIVDTAPTGHMLRLIDAPAAHAAFAAALRAMADKAAAVAAAMTGRSARLAGESIIEELEERVTTFRQRVLGRAAFVVASSTAPVVAAETRRLVTGLRQRGLGIVAVVARPDAETGTHHAEVPAGADDLPADAVRVEVPWLRDVTRCEGLRSWTDAIAHEATPAPPPAAPEERDDPHERGAAAAWLASAAPRLLLFAGKGGVGKTTCAAAAALALSDSRDVFLCSADPAGSLDDVFGGPVTAAGRVGPRLRVAQIQPAAELQRLRDAYAGGVGQALERLGLDGGVELDRRVVESLWEVAPPGIDELAAVAAMLDAAGADETVIIDAAPTGHFLRLLAMPEVALDWTRQLMRVIVKYGLSGTADDAAASLLRLSRRLRALQARVHGEEAAVVVVTLAEPMVEAETDRLLAELERTNVRVAAVLRNRAAGSGAGRRRPIGGTDRVLEAPVRAALTGERALREFVASWKIEA